MVRSLFESVSCLGASLSYDYLAGVVVEDEGSFAAVRPARSDETLFSTGILLVRLIADLLRVDGWLNCLAYVLTSRECRQSLDLVDEMGLEFASLVIGGLQQVGLDTRRCTRVS